MNTSQIARTIDLFAMAFVFGATAWFFFVQSPVLLKMLGRDKFVPIQMRLTAVLFSVLTVLLLVMLAAVLGHSPIGSGTTLTAAIALAAGVINKFVVVPKALKAGGQSRIAVKGKDVEASTSTFASEGVGNQTQLLHRLVVLFVVIMVVAVVAHGVRLLAA
jgi:hypothetical protein